MTPLIILLYGGIVCGLSFIAFCLLMSAGVVCCRAQEEYWEEIWDETPCTEAGLAGYSEIRPEKLRKAA